MDTQLLIAIAAIIGAVSGLASISYNFAKKRTEDHTAENFKKMVETHDELVRTLKQDTEEMIKSHDGLIQSQKQNIESIIKSSEDHIELRKNEVEAMVRSNEALIQTLKSDTSAMLESHGELVQAFKLDVDSLRREVGILRAEVERRGKIDELELEHKKQEVAQRKAEQTWGIITDVAKGAGWVIKHKDLFKKK